MIGAKITSYRDESRQVTRFKIEVSDLNLAKYLCDIREAACVLAPHSSIAMAGAPPESLDENTFEPISPESLPAQFMRLAYLIAMENRENGR